jgi:hypothetical protein
MRLFFFFPLIIWNASVSAGLYRLSARNAVDQNSFFFSSFHFYPHCPHRFFFCFFRFFLRFKLMTNEYSGLLYDLGVLYLRLPYVINLSLSRKEDTNFVFLLFSPFSINKFLALLLLLFFRLFFIIRHFQV